MQLNSVLLFLLRFSSCCTFHIQPTQMPAAIECKRDVKCIEALFFFFLYFSSQTLREISNLRIFFSCSAFFCVHSMQMMHNNNEVSECLCSTYLLQYWSDVFQRQRRKLILLQEVVQILLEHFKHQTRVILVLEAFEGSHKIELVSIFLA